MKLPHISLKIPLRHQSLLIAIIAFVQGRGGVSRPKRTENQDLTDVNLKILDHIRNAILLVLESFNEGRFLKEPWGLICNVIVNQPTQPKLISLLDILQASKPVSINVTGEASRSSAVNALTSSSTPQTGILHESLVDIDDASTGPGLIWWSIKLR